MSRRRTSDRGFSILEVTFAVAVSGALLAVLTGALVVYLRTAGPTADRLGGSRDAQLVSTYLAPDIQSATTVDASGTTTCSGVANLVSLEWSSTVSLIQTDTYVAAYSIQASGGQRDLVRSFCVNGGSPASRVVADDLHPTADPTLALTDVAGDVVEVEMTVTTKPTDADPAGYEFTVAANRRSDR